jgi:hypothetical protein
MLIIRLLISVGEYGDLPADRIVKAPKWLLD